MMVFSKRLLIMLLILMLAVAACGGDDDSDESSSNGDGDTTSQQSDGGDNDGDAVPAASGGDLPADAAAAFDGMAPGSYMLDVTGELVGSGGADNYTGQDLAIDYDPAPNNPNDEGFAQLRARVDAGQDENGEPVYAEVDIRIPYGTAPGVYEVIAVDNDDTSGSVQAEVGGSGFGQSFNDGSTGTVALVEFGDFLTASFDFTSQNITSNDETETSVTGRVFQIPFDANPFSTLTISGVTEASVNSNSEGLLNVQYVFDNFADTVELDMTWTNDDFSISYDVRLSINKDIEPGEYEVTQYVVDNGNNRLLDDGQLAAAFIDVEDEANGIDFRSTSLNGTLNIDIDEQGKIFGTYTLTGTDDAGTEATAEATFDFLRNTGAQLFVREDAG